MNKMNILARACNQALFIEPNYATTFFSALCLKTGVNNLVSSEGQQLDASGMQQLASSYESKPRERPYRVYENVAVLPISGTLLHKYGYVQPVSGATGYDGIAARLQAAIDDPSIDGILLDFDSPGGEVAGCFDTAALIKELREQKPIVALCYDTMCSAAMALGSQCTERWITQSGRIGSVGVLVAHSSYQKQLEDEGIEITLIHSGSHKVDGNPYQKLPDEVRQKIQTEIDSTRQQFAELVAGGIGMDVNAVLATEASVYTGQAGVDVGFANRVVNGHEAVDLMLNFVKTKKRGQSFMTNANAADTANPVTLDAQPVAPVASVDAVATERARISAILTCAEAKGREQLANHIAFATSMSAQDAVGMLAAAPVAQPVAEAAAPVASANLATALDRAMSATPQPNLTATDGDPQSASDARVASLVATHNLVKGVE